jgi:hypothetical protein
MDQKPEAQGGEMTCPNHTAAEEQKQELSPDKHADPLLADTNFHLVEI